eukprot:671800-Prorocentrum_minimum.AAC.1
MCTTEEFNSPPPQRDASLYSHCTLTVLSLYSHCTLTVLSLYSPPPQRDATQMAGEAAGLENVRLLREPQAAALAYGVDRQQVTHPPPPHGRL